MSFAKTINKSEVEEFDLFFYRPASVYGRGITLYDAFSYWYNPKILFRILFRLSFSHVAIALRDSKNNLRRFDAMEGCSTGFRKNFGQCYVFTLQLTIQQKEAIKKQILARKGSRYDRKGIISFLFPLFAENEFKDFCSELIKNALVLTGGFSELHGEQVSPLSLYTILRPKLTFKGLLLS